MSDHDLSHGKFIAADADRVLSELVPMAGLVHEAVADNKQLLGEARLSDFRQALRGDDGLELCPVKLRSLLLIAAMELHRLGWKPDDHPDAANVDPDEHLPASPPEVQWGADK